jgi:hypothetical protein
MDTVDGRRALVPRPRHARRRRRTGAHRQGRAVVGLCPITEANLGDGLFDVPDFLTHDGAAASCSDCQRPHLPPPMSCAPSNTGKRLIQRQRNVLGRTARRSTGRRACFLRRRSPAAGKAVGTAADDAVVVLDTGGPFQGDAIVESLAVHRRQQAVMSVHRSDIRAGRGRRPSRPGQYRQALTGKPSRPLHDYEHGPPQLPSTANPLGSVPVSAPAKAFYATPARLPAHPARVRKSADRGKSWTERKGTARGQLRACFR